MESPFLLPCFYKQFFGVSCPFCGLQRSLWLFCQGEWGKAIAQFPLWVVWAMTLLLLLFLKRTKRMTASYLHPLIWANAAALLLNAIYQNLYY